MKRHLLLGTLGIPVLCVLVLGVALILLARQEVWTSARDRLREQAASAAVDVEDRLELNRPLNLRPLVKLMPDRRITVIGPTGRLVTSVGTAPPAALTAHATASDYAVTVQAPRDPVVARARDVTLILIGLAIAALAAAAGLAVWQSRRLAAPVARLLAHADDLAAATSPPPRSSAASRKSTQ